MTNWPIKKYTKQKRYMKYIYKIYIIRYMYIRLATYNPTDTSDHNPRQVSVATAPHFGPVLTLVVAGRAFYGNFTDDASSRTSMTQFHLGPCGLEKTLLIDQISPLIFWTSPDIKFVGQPIIIIRACLNFLIFSGVVFLFGDSLFGADVSGSGYGAPAVGYGAPEGTQ